MKMISREAELMLVEKIINGEDVIINTEKLFISLRPVFSNVIRRYGKERDREDLMQEMYIALLRAIDKYKEKRDDPNYEFIALLYGCAKSRTNDYLCKYYKTFTDKDGRKGVYDSYRNALSLNERVSMERDIMEHQDILPSQDDIEAEYIQRETDTERVVANRVIWDEVNKLNPIHRDAVINYYYKGISHVEIGKTIGISESTSRTRLHNSLRKLKSNPAIREAAVCYLPSIAFRGNFSFFKSMQMSSTELIALNNIEREERRTNRYILTDTSIFGNKTMNVVARYTGLCKDTVRNLMYGESVTIGTAETIARFYGLQLDDYFEVVKTESKNYILADTDFFTGRKRSDVDKEKLIELDFSQHKVDNAVYRLQKGGRVNAVTAKKLVALYNVSFNSMFSPD